MLLPNIQTMFQVLKVTSLLPLSVILAGGGLLSMCDVLSLTGMNPHHHLGAVETASICVHDCSQHKEPEPVPCPEDCHIPIPDAEVTKDTVFVFGVNPILLPWSQDTDAHRTRREIEAPGIWNRAPPGNSSRLTSSPHTGRFLL